MDVMDFETKFLGRKLCKGEAITRLKLIFAITGSMLLVVGCGQQNHPDYAIFKNVPSSEVSSIKKVIQEESINNLELPTVLPYPVTMARCPTPAIDPQRKHVITIVLGNSSSGRALELNASSNPSKTIHEQTVKLPNEQVTKLSDGTKSLYGSNGHGSQLAWVKNGVLYFIMSVNKQGSSDLTEQQLIYVADSFK